MKQKGNSVIMLIIVIAVLLIGVYLLMQRSQKTANTTTQSSSELNQASANLGAVGVDSVDNDLSQNDADTATF